MKIELTTYRTTLAGVNAAGRSNGTHIFIFTNDGHFIFTDPITDEQKSQIIAACQGNKVPISIEKSEDKSVIHYYIEDKKHHIKS
jgi:hypothetical protein